MLASSDICTVVEVLSVEIFTEGGRGRLLACWCMQMALPLRDLECKSICVILESECLCIGPASGFRSYSIYTTYLSEYRLEFTPRQ